MSNETVIKEFLEGRQAKTPLRNIKSKYSSTKSHIQSKIRQLAMSKGLEIVEVKGIDL